MKKKKLLILLSILLLTGCQAEYNIVIDENTVKEELLIYETNMSKWSTIQGNNVLTYQQYQQTYKDAPIGVYYNDQNVDAEIGFNPDRKYYTINLIDDKIKFTDEACKRLVKVPRVFLNTVLKGCVAWAKEHDCILITEKEIDIIQDKRSKDKNE